MTPKFTHLIAAASMLGVATMSPAADPVEPVNKPFWEDSSRGWHWYEVIPEPAQPESTEKQQPGATVVVTPQTKYPYQAKILEFREQMEEAKAEAILNPSVVATAKFMRLQKQMLGMASIFTDNWKQALLDYPDLDSTLEHPVTQMGVNIANDTELQKQQEAARALGKVAGIFYFYKVDCPYCQRETPIIKQFAADFGVPLLPIALDARKFGELPTSVVDNGWAAKLGVQYTPSMYLVDPKSGNIVPIGYGLHTRDQLLARFGDILNDKKLPFWGAAQ